MEAETKIRNARGIGERIRNTVECPWWIINIGCRTVAVRKIAQNDRRFRSCSDCGVESNLLVVELSQFTRNKSHYPLVWGWCGICDIGT